MRKLLALSLAMVVGGCTSADLTPNQARVQEQILEDRFQEWVTALNNRDFEDIDAMYMHTDDVDIIWPDGNRAQGWTEQELAIRNFYQTINYLNFGPQGPEAHVINADFAVVTYRHSTTTDFRMTGRSVSAGWGMMLWENDPEDGVWKIRASLTSTNPPAQ